MNTATKETNMKFSNPFTERQWEIEKESLPGGPENSDDPTPDQITAQESAEAEDYEMDKWMEETEEL